MKWNVRRTAKYYYIRLKRLQGNPNALATGAGLGAAIAITPTLPLHTVMIVAATLACRASTIAGLLVATLISNPLTFALHYWLAWFIGDFIFPGRLSWPQLKSALESIRQQGIIDSLYTLSELSLDALLVLQTGGLVLAVPLGFSTYFLSYYFFRKIEKKRQQKHLLN